MLNRDPDSGNNFFIANEVEHTPAFDMKTLFVVGYQTQDAINHALQSANLVNHPVPIQHIFFGANDSFHPRGADEHTAWENVIFTYLARGFWCSLDIPFGQVKEFNEGGLCEHDRFIPIIKVPIPYTKLWNYNTCVKIDDKGFADTNPGVWVHTLHSLMSRENFTDWSQYNNDKVV